MQGEWIKHNQSGSPVIVFVHGVLSSGETYWRHSSGGYWPEIVSCDPELSTFGVYIFSYRTGFFSGTYRLGDAVDALKEQLHLDGILEVGRIIFVCHSMGGILVRKYLVERATELAELDTNIALFLIASPSLGSQYANWLKPIAKFFGHSQADALRFSQSNSWLMDLDREFTNLKEGQRIRLHGKELVEDQFIWLRSFWRKQLVEPFAGARYFGEPFKVPESDHFSIAKIENNDAIQHRLLRRFSLKWFLSERNSIFPDVDIVSEGGQSQRFSELSSISNKDNQLQDDWKAYQNVMMENAIKNDWWQHPIPILANETDQPMRSARDIIQNWITDTEAKHCILLGEPGSGKTGLLIWIASTITQRSNNVAIWVSAKRLRDLSEINMTTVLTICDPIPPIEILHNVKGREVYFLLDGLDELTGAAEDGETVAAALLRRTLARLRTH